MTALAAAGLTLLALAGPVQKPETPPGDRRPREEAARMVDAYILSNLQESLALTDEQFVKLLPLVKRLQSERRDYVQRRFRLLREMRKQLESGTATEPRVLEMLKELKAVEAAEPERMRRSVEAIDASLTPLQQAKFRILEVEIDQKIRELMNQIRRQGRPPGRPGRGEPPSPGEPPRP